MFATQIPQITPEDIRYVGMRTEIDPRFLGTLSLNPFYCYSSSSRMYMFSGHINSSVVLNHASKKTIVTMYEREYGKYTFSIKAPCNMKVIKTFKRYDSRYGKGAMKENSQTYVMYMDCDNPQNVGVIEIPSYFNINKDFGFRYVIKKSFTPGDEYLKDEILADSPSVDNEGDWRYGIELNIAFMSIAGIIQDGFVISESCAQKMATTTYGRRMFRIGSDDIPLNTYGDENNYQPFPKIGDYIRPDGLLFAKRRLSNRTLDGNDFDYSLAPLKLSPKSLLASGRDSFYDSSEYGRPNAKVIDVRIHASSSSKHKIPTGMHEYLDNYVEQSNLFYSKILEAYEEIRNERKRLKQNLREMPELQNLVAIAMAETNIAENKKGNKLVKTYKSDPIADDYLVEIVFEDSNVPLTIGSKITGLHGNKGVVCDIWPDSWMPKDAAGNVTDIIGDGDSTQKRTNTGVLYEQCYNAFRRELEETLRSLFGIDKKHPTKDELLRCKNQREIMDLAWDYVSAFVVKASPLMYEYLIEALDLRKFTKDDFVMSVLEDRLRTYWPQNTAKSWPQIIKDLRDNFPITFGPVEYVDVNGNLTVTKDNVMIGEMYFIRLDKLGEDWAAVSSPKMSAHGTPSKLTSNDKYSNPGRTQSTRFWGESEMRLGEAYVGSEPVAEQLDRTNNAIKHEHILKQIHRSLGPMDIKDVLGCQDYPRGDGRPLQFINHMIECYGARFTRHVIH